MYLIAGVRIFENLQVGGGSGAGGFEVHEGVVAAVAGCGAGDFALEVGDELHCLAEQGEDLLGLRRALDDEIVAGAAAHGAPVDDALLPPGVVAQEGGGEVLHGVEGTRGEGRLAVGGRHADVEGGDDVA